MRPGSRLDIHSTRELLTVRLITEPAKKGKYTFLERNYENDEDEAEEQQVKDEDADEKSAVESKLPKQTQRLMELIFNQNHFNAVLEQIGYNANKLPLGKLSKATLKQGFEHLHELASLIKHPSLADNKYQTSQKEVSVRFKAFSPSVFAPAITGLLGLFPVRSDIVNSYFARTCLLPLTKYSHSWRFHYCIFHLQKP